MSSQVTPVRLFFEPNSAVGTGGNTDSVKITEFKVNNCFAVDHAYRIVRANLDAFPRAAAIIFIDNNFHRQVLSVEGNPRILKVIKAGQSNLLGRLSGRVPAA